MNGTGRNSLLRRHAILCDLGLRPLLLAGLLLAAGTTTVCAAGPPAAGAGASPRETAEAIARQTVADAMGSGPDGISVISTEARDFSDGSLGCPQPGMAYAQVITPGYRVLVEVEGRRFDVRVAGTGGKLCFRRKPATTPEPLGKAGRPSIQPSPGEAARQDLALRLRLPIAAVMVTGERALRPGDTLPGCGVVCATDAKSGSCGSQVRLRADDRDYDYVTRPGGVQPCPDIASR